MDETKIIMIISIVIVVVCILFLIIDFYMQRKIKSAIEKQMEEDKRIRARYHFTTYAEEQQKNQLLRSQYESLRLQKENKDETLRLREENQRLQEEINRLKKEVEQWYKTLCCSRKIAQNYRRKWSNTINKRISCSEVYYECFWKTK